MDQISKRLYKVLRTVGVGKDTIVNAQDRNELFLDSFDSLLLVYYFELEFNVVVKEEEVSTLNTVLQVDSFLSAQHRRLTA